MPAFLVQLAVVVVELFAKYGPGLIEVGANLVHAIETHGELSEEEKAVLIARVKATRAAVAAYEPRPHAGSPTVEMPEPAPTPKVR